MLKLGDVQLRGRSDGLLARNLCVGVHRHHGEKLHESPPADKRNSEPKRPNFDCQLIGKLCETMIRKLLKHLYLRIRLTSLGKFNNE
ncbi:hypothetical protein CEXT_54421 [Caerostris extrusa]|uniref:Uncharacterized protein n=1 Tax=Caerostris extrusa TaxID=172846 RepID=A0AAV4QN36_CAEEX|nr:hypothetical protein CEXT_54421 [Caerostris extrusa]